jgi:hypothetical protein
MLLYASCIAVVITLSCLDICAQTGGTAGAYLREPVGATMTAMGGAQSAAPQYAATWWNPAQLCFLDKSTLSAGAGMYSLGRTEAFSSYEFRLPPRVGMGFFALYRGDPFVDKLYASDETQLPAAAYTAMNLKVALSYIFSRRLSAGLALTMYYESLPTAYTENTNESGTIMPALQYSDATTIGGFTFGLQYRCTDSLTVAFVIRDVNPLQMLSGKPAGIIMNWQLSSASDYSALSTDVILPAFVLGATFRNQLDGYPLLVSCDINGYPVDGTFTKLDYMEARIHAGAEWKRWKTFRIRAGLDDIPVNRSLFAKGDDNVDYWRDFTMRVTGGFGWDVVVMHRKMELNYSLATDKVWAGVDQLVDVVYKF